MKSKWDQENLKTLINQSELSSAELIQSIGIKSESIVRNWLAGRSVPTIHQLIALADLFGVSMDYICGRCSAEESEAIKKDYKQYFFERETAVYLQYLAIPKKKEKMIIYAKAPWPYNLLEFVFGRQWDAPLTIEQEKGLNHAISLLSEKNRDYVYLRFRDGLTYAEIAEKCNEKKTQCNAHVMRACNYLRHPSLSKYILGGMPQERPEPNDLEKELIARKRAANKLERDIEAKEAYLKIKERETEQKANDSGINTDNIDETLLDPIECLGLSTRAYNILRFQENKGRKIKLVQDIVKYADELMTFRGMGIVTLQEIIDKVYDYAHIQIYPQTNTAAEANSDM